MHRAHAWRCGGFASVRGTVTDQLDMAYAQPGRYWLRDELGRVVVRWSEAEL
ncbi:hypothetical protein OK006_6242 [Actinobacteria bacterium OK006]|nr:hypothetical protein OK006_6242 [Actinobacteria bacterium OK006]